MSQNNVEFAVIREDIFNLNFAQCKFRLFACLISIFNFNLRILIVNLS